MIAENPNPPPGRHRHLRIAAMVTRAWYAWGLTPTAAELESLIDATDGKCPQCKQSAGLEGSASNSFVMRYENETLFLVCRSCFLKRRRGKNADLPDDQRWCPKCEQAKPVEAFPATTSETGTRCKACVSKATAIYNKNRRERERERAPNMSPAAAETRKTAMDDYWEWMEQKTAARREKP